MHCRLANSITFQRLAWHGTEAAKKGATQGAEALKNSAAYRTTQYKAMEQMNRIRSTEAFKEFEAKKIGHGTMKTMAELRDKVLTELKQTRLK